MSKFPCLPRLFRYGARPWFGKLASAVILACQLAAGNAPAGEGTVEIAVLGDSLVQGYGLPPDKGFVAQMQDWLDARGADVVLINAGVSGDTTAGGLSRIDWTLGPQVDAVVVSLGGNDVLRGIDPAVSRRNLRGILSRISADGLPSLIIGIAAPGNYGPDYKRDFDAIYPELAEEFGALLHPNFLRALIERPDRADTLARFYQPDALHPNADGVRIIVDDLGPIFLQLAQRAHPGD